ncbi:hypothetical protein A7U60_g7444 [Sanghuangporus baumii]|uniref:Uncharacterized protein n=1 Tax=Sanghuangporus baumii TaxID=108892 RepID=A0A9Q5HT00_SANBA|nr:hypothetical protein A7U60_g7444 [Sanghuangporus baumii]
MLFSSVSTFIILSTVVAFVLSARCTNADLCKKARRDRNEIDKGDVHQDVDSRVTPSASAEATNALDTSTPSDGSIAYISGTVGDLSASIGPNDSSSAMDLMTSLKSSITDPDGNEKDASVSSGSTGNANGGNVNVDGDEGNITNNGATFRAGNGGISISGDAISGNGSKGDGANFRNDASGGSFTSSLNDAFNGSTVHASNRVR